MKNISLDSILVDLKTPKFPFEIYWPLTDNSNHAEEFVLALQARVEAKKSDVHEADKLKWEQEQIISNKTAKLDEHKRDCNRLIIGLDIEESESKKLMKAEPEYIQSWAHE